jgi:hypothetical protein
VATTSNAFGSGLFVPRLGMNCQFLVHKSD